MSGFCLALHGSHWGFPLSCHDPQQFGSPVCTPQMQESYTQLELTILFPEASRENAPAPQTPDLGRKMAGAGGRMTSQKPRKRLCSFPKQSPSETLS